MSGEKITTVSILRSVKDKYLPFILAQGYRNFSEFTNDAIRRLLEQLEWQNPPSGEREENV